MSDNDAYIRATIRTWVWSGFYDEDLVVEMLDDILEDDTDINAMHEHIAAEFARKAGAEKTWPRETDNDRLDRVFIALDAGGVCAVQNAGYTMSDGYSDVSEAVADRGPSKYHGYVFYHGQDLERAVEGNGLMLAFGDLEDDPVKGIAVGKTVCAALQTAGFATQWDGTIDDRINIPTFDWKRRI